MGRLHGSRILRAGVAGVLAALVLAGCSDDGDDSGDAAASGSDPVEVEVGEGFTWNDFTVEDGWQLKGVERTVDMDQVTTPEVSGTIVNDAAETRAAIFSMVFSADGDPVATVNCTAPTMQQDQSMQFLCPGINTTMPEDYDTVTVQEFTRDTGGSGDSESGT